MPSIQSRMARENRHRKKLFADHYDAWYKAMEEVNELMDENDAKHNVDAALEKLAYCETLLLKPTHSDPRACRHYSFMGMCYEEKTLWSLAHTAYQMALACAPPREIDEVNMQNYIRVRHCFVAYHLNRPDLTIQMVADVDKDNASKGQTKKILFYQQNTGDHFWDQFRLFCFEQVLRDTYSEESKDVFEPFITWMSNHVPVFKARYEALMKKEQETAKSSVVGSPLAIVPKVSKSRQKKKRQQQQKKKASSITVVADVVHHVPTSSSSSVVIVEEEKKLIPPPSMETVTATKE